MWNCWPLILLGLRCPRRISEEFLSVLNCHPLRGFLGRLVEGQNDAISGVLLSIGLLLSLPRRVTTGLEWAPCCQSSALQRLLQLPCEIDPHFPASERPSWPGFSHRTGSVLPRHGDCPCWDSEIPSWPGDRSVVDQRQRLSTERSQTEEALKKERVNQRSKPSTLVVGHPGNGTVPNVEIEGHCRYSTQH
jgi:hypothetical protein